MLDLMLMKMKARTILVMAVLAFCSSCSSIFIAKWPPAVDPLKGWNSWSSDDEESHPSMFFGHSAQPAKHTPLNKGIRDDYQNYLGKDEPNYYTMELSYYEDGTGQHAVRVQTYTMDRDSYVFIFIYDKSNVRVKVKKYYYGHYSC